MHNPWQFSITEPTLVKLPNSVEINHSLRHKAAEASPSRDVLITSLLSAECPLWYHFWVSVVKPASHSRSTEVPLLCKREKKSQIVGLTKVQMLFIYFFLKGSGSSIAPVGDAKQFARFVGIPTNAVTRILPTKELDCVKMLTLLLK